MGTRREVPADGFYRFENNKIWHVEAGMIGGTVSVPETLAGEQLVDCISDEATGWEAGLEAITFTRVGAGFVRFTGSIKPLMEISEEALIPVRWTEADKMCLKLQYGLGDVEVKHAIDAGQVIYGEECCLDCSSGRQIRTPAYPSECTYVRVVIDGFELAYWNSSEVAEDAADVMGALIGSAKGGSC